MQISARAGRRAFARASTRRTRRRVRCAAGGDSASREVLGRAASRAVR
jgi:hypothetical protein